MSCLCCEGCATAAARQHPRACPIETPERAAAAARSPASGAADPTARDDSVRLVMEACRNRPCQPTPTPPGAREVLDRLPPRPRRVIHLMLPPTTLASALRDTEWFHVAYTIPYERYLPLRTDLLRPLARPCLLGRRRQAHRVAAALRRAPDTPIAMSCAMVAIRERRARRAGASRDPRDARDAWPQPWIRDGPRRCPGRADSVRQHRGRRVLLLLLQGAPPVVRPERRHGRRSSSVS